MHEIKNRVLRLITSLFFGLAGWFVYWGDTSLLEVPSWAKAGLLVALFALYAWIADWAIFRFALPRLQQAGLSVKSQAASFFAAIFAGLFFVVVLHISPLVKAKQSLEIIATGDRNPLSEGSDVSLQGLYHPEGSSVDFKEFVRLGKGKWENLGGPLVAKAKFPARLKWETMRGETIRLVFFTNPTSGFVQLVWNGTISNFDLFSTTYKQKEIRLIPGYPFLYQEIFWLASGTLIGLSLFMLAVIGILRWIKIKSAGIPVLALVKQFIHFSLSGTIVVLLIAWGFLASINWFFRLKPFQFDLSRFFPISVFSGPFLHINGLVHFSTFLVLLVLAIDFSRTLKSFQVWLLGILLIIFGNLGQGSFNAAFFRLFPENGREYYNDALTITSWTGWLSSYNANQTGLLLRTQTHPPFAVLIHKYLLLLGNGNVAFLALGFVLLSSLAILLMWQVFKILEIPQEQRVKLTLLFAVIPAINIYNVMSLEGIVVSASALFLLGLVLLVKERKISALAIVCLVIGFSVANLLNYMGIYLLAVGGLVGLWQFISEKKPQVLIGMGATALAFVVLAWFMEYWFDYNHLQGFITTSRLENPKGFRLFAEPLSYLMTRIEDISEMAFFLSFPCLAILFHRDRLQACLLDHREDVFRVAISAAAVLLLLFLSGAFRTGETARGMLFAYPFLVLAFIGVDSPTLTVLLVLTGLQTALMQLFGNYLW